MKDKENNSSDVITPANKRVAMFALGTLAAVATLAALVEGEVEFDDRKSFGLPWFEGQEWRWKIFK